MKKDTPVREIESLLDISMRALWREMDVINRYSVQGKLDTNTSRDLINYVKLLREMKKEEDELLASMTDDELNNLAKKD